MEDENGKEEFYKMKRLRYYVKIYMILASRYVKARMEYKTDFLISMFGIFFENILSLAFYSVIFFQVKQIGEWNYYELVFMYGFMVMASSFFHVFFGNMFNLKAYLINGDFTKFYFRPLNILFSYVSETIDIKSIFQFVIGAFLLITSSCELNLKWTWSGVMLLCILLISSAIIITSIMTICASFGFWVRDPSVIMDFMLKIKDYSKYPLSIYNPILRIVFTFVIPLGFMSYYPSLRFVKGMFCWDVKWVMLQLIITVILFLGAIRIFIQGSKFYDGVGH